MTAAKHTPGPWAWDGQSRVDALPFRKIGPHKVVDHDGVERDYMEGMVAIPYGCGGPGTHDGNALLIAAAPSLLSELKNLSFLLMSACFVINDADARETALAAVKRARDAIAKAEGSTS